MFSETKGRTVLCVGKDFHIEMPGTGIEVYFDILLLMCKMLLPQNSAWHDHVKKKEQSKPLNLIIYKGKKTISDHIHTHTQKNCLEFHINLTR